jgi:hypothetical protein
MGVLRINRCLAITKDGRAFANIGKIKAQTMSHFDPSSTSTTTTTTTGPSTSTTTTTPDSNLANVTLAYNVTNVTESGFGAPFPGNPNIVALSGDEGDLKIRMNNFHII